MPMHLVTQFSLVSFCVCLAVEIVMQTMTHSKLHDFQLDRRYESQQLPIQLDVLMTAHGH